MRRVLIAGCGYVGSALAARLVDEGCAVWGLRRQPEGLPPGVRPLAADLARPDTLRELPPELDAVVYAASAGGGGEAAYRSAYVEGVGNLLDALVAAGQAPRRVVFTSSTGVYAQREGEWVDESSPTEPTGASGTALLEGERRFLDGPFPATVLRLGGIYGPGRDRLVRETRAGSAVCPGGAPRYSNRIHRDDCAGALHHLLDLPDPEPLYVGVDREPAELCTVLRWLAERLDRPPPPVSDNAPAGRMGRRSNKRCSSARLVASGYRFRFPTFREGFDSMIASGPA